MVKGSPGACVRCRERWAQAHTRGLCRRCARELGDERTTAGIASLREQRQGGGGPRGGYRIFEFPRPRPVVTIRGQQYEIVGPR